MISESYLYKRYRHYKEAAAKALASGDADAALDAMQLACILAKNYYLCYQDDDIESLLREVSNAVPKVSGDSTTDPERFVFYDTHATDNIALTQQYLGALIAWDVEFTYLSAKPLTTPSTRLIAEMLGRCDKATVIEIPQGGTILERAGLIRDLVVGTHAGRAFVQTTADDLAGVLAFSSCPGVRSWYIDLSDHSFWAGSTFFDRYIAFRSYGYNISVTRRGIPPESVLVQPFYPTLASKEYKGVPALSPTSIRLLSGGRTEKIYGENDKYFQLVERILAQNPEVEFYYAGGGAFGKTSQTSYIESQLARRSIGPRFHLLGFRDDIIDVMEHMDIYIGTYPMGGGLMTQQVASKGLPIVQYVSEGLSNSVDEFLSMPRDDPDSFVFFEDDEGFLRRVSELVDNPSERTRLGQKYQSAVLKKDEFDAQLHWLVYEDAPSHQPRIYDVDCTALRRNQINVENNCYHSYQRIIVRSKYAMRHEPLEWARSAVVFVCFSDKRWLMRQILSRLRTKYPKG